MFDRAKFEAAINGVAARYEKTAPTVSDWCDLLCAARDDSITLADVQLLAELQQELPPPNLAANKVYHRMTYANQSTTGQAGF